jgi:hypothetical protein
MVLDEIVPIHPTIVLHTKLSWDNYMAVVKLTKTLIDSLAFATVSGKHIYYYDTELKGFGLRVTTQAKTYFVEGKIAN